MACVCLSVCVQDIMMCKLPKVTCIGITKVGRVYQVCYFALDFVGSRNRKSFSTLRCQGVSVGSGNFTFFRAFRKKFPRGPGDGFCSFVCFRTSKISGYFRELNKMVSMCTNLRAASRPSGATLACGSNLVFMVVTLPEKLVNWGLWLLYGRRI